MTDNVENIILEHLRALRSGQDRIEFELKELKARISHLESAVIGGRRDIVMTEENAYRQQNSIDKLTDRLDALEKLVRNVSV